MLSTIVLERVDKEGISPHTRQEKRKGEGGERKRGGGDNLESGAIQIVDFRCVSRGAPSRPVLRSCTAYATISICYHQHTHIIA